jgi:cytochrome c
MDRLLRVRVAIGFAVVTPALIFGAAHAAAAGDAVKGAEVFKRCMVCHTTDKGGANKIGPNLFGVAGRAAGTAPGYNYSSAMKNAGLSWTDANLTEYLTNPKKKVPGDKMSFAGISNPDQVADLVAYLHTLK